MDDSFYINTFDLFIRAKYLIQLVSINFNSLFSPQ